MLLLGTPKFALFVFDVNLAPPIVTAAMPRDEIKVRETFAF